jgi:hypothetical protein
MSENHNHQTAVSIVIRKSDQFGFSVVARDWIENVDLILSTGRYREEAIIRAIKSFTHLENSLFDELLLSRREMGARCENDEK